MMAVFVQLNNERQMCLLLWGEREGGDKTREKMAAKIIENLCF